MNYYKFNIGDYAAATRHLTMLEHGAYRLLMDVYYTTEQPLPSDVKASARKTGARAKDEIAAVEVVLKEFFTLTDAGWIQSRCDSEISLFKSKAETNKVVGKLGGRPKKITQTVSTGNPEITQTVSEVNPHETLTTNQEPLTINHSVAEATGGAPPFDPISDPKPLVTKPLLTDPAEIIFGYGLSMLVNAGVTTTNARSFLGLQRKLHGDAALICKLRECAKAKVLQPLEWLAAAMPPPDVAGAKPNKQEALEARNSAIADAWANEQGVEIETV